MAAVVLIWRRCRGKGSCSSPSPGTFVVSQVVSRGGKGGDRPLTRSAGSHFPTLRADPLARLLDPVAGYVQIQDLLRRRPSHYREDRKL